MGRAKKTESKKTTATKKRTTKKSTAKKVATKVTENSSSGELASVPLQDDAGTPEVEVEVKRGEDVVILETSEGSIGFNTRDKLQGDKLVVMNLSKGLNKVPLSLFEAFEEDDFFVDHILGGGVVKVISRPGKSLDKVDI